jgi:hypothetical protein
VRKGLVVLAVSVVTVTACDLTVKRIAEDGAAGRLASSFELGVRPEVTFGGFPFTPALLAGRIASAEIAAADLGRKGLRLARLELTLEGLTFSLDDLLAGRVETVRSGGGRGRAEIADTAIAALLRRRGAAIKDLSFDAGRVRVTGPMGEVEGRVEVRGRLLVVAAPGLGEVALELPALGGRVIYEGLEVGDGVAVLSLRLTSGRLAAP